MQKTTTTIKMQKLTAADGMVLCDGTTRTSVGGQVLTPADADVSGWVEMTAEEADALIAARQATETGEEG